MSKRTLAAIIRQWRTPLKKIGNRPSPANKIDFIKRAPSSLEAKIAVSPYASVLASPLRTCTFYSRQFPSKLLLRFGQGWHQPTKALWAFPTLKKSSGKGVYVTLSKKILDLFGKGGYKSAFRGSAVYRIDMLDHVQSLICEESFMQFSKRPIKIFHVLTPSTSSQWTSSESSAMGYQCILSFEPTGEICELDHTIDAQHHHIPYYNVNHIWTKEQIESIKLPGSTVIGVPKTLETVELSVALWRCRELLC
ncbi:hypothetical protein EDC94DRAFT_417597 [Helicostylum pulchrum]|nr:hypothetical protein EDC94DRAFT_417597 [Helicostylum pulchrum]